MPEAGGRREPVHLTRVSLRGFRNLRDQALDFPPEGVAILGRNAQGKTNLLEAIAYLETFRSFRGAGDERLVRFGEDVFRILGELEGDEHAGGPRSISAAFQAGSRTKRVTVDERVPERIGDAIGHVGTVLFTPRDVRLVSDGPSERRRFLDILLSLNDPAYLMGLQRFRQALAQRNAALRGSDPSHAGAWEGALRRWGAEVAWARAAWVREAAQTFSDHYSEVFGDATARLHYESSIPAGADASGPEEVAAAFGQALDRSRARERQRGLTLVGPHRDELRVFVRSSGADEMDVREYGSGGQRRTAALAFRLSEADTLRRRGREPILLLDDVFAELDEERSGRLLRVLDRIIPGQVILTAPKEGDVRFREDLLPRWSIEAGEVSA